MDNESSETAAEVKDLICAVARKWLTLEIVGWQNKGEYGNAVYRVKETGHQIVVFWDAGDYDYIDSVIFPDGRVVGFNSRSLDFREGMDGARPFDEFGKIVIELGEPGFPS